MQNNNINFIIDGEIYLKRAPKVNNYSQLIEETKDTIFDIEFDISKEKPDFSKSKSLDEYRHQLNRIQHNHNQLDYSENIYFWQLSTEDGQTISLTICTPYIGNKNIVYHSIERMNQDYIKLSEFLEKATFVGRKFRRTKPIINTDGEEDLTYTKDSLATVINTQYIVLYATQELFLIKRIDMMHKDEYSLIVSKYTLDGNYEFFGPVYEEYKDKNKVYTEILEQVSNYNRGKRKIK